MIAELIRDFALRVHLETTVLPSRIKLPQILFDRLASEVCKADRRPLVEQIVIETGHGRVLVEPEW